MNEFFLSIDVLDIPLKLAYTMAPLWGISFSLFIIFFVVSIIRESSLVIESGMPHYSRILKKAFLLFIGLFLYRWIFMKIVALCEGIGMAIVNQGDWSQFLAMLKNHLDVYGTVPWFKLSFVNVLVGILSAVIYSIEYVYIMVRYCFLSFLYVFGPLSFAFAMWEQTGFFLKNWFLLVLQGSFCIVTFKIAQAVLMSFQLDTLLSAVDPITLLVVCLGFTVMTIGSVYFCFALISGENLGHVGSALAGVGTSCAGYASRAGVGTISAGKGISAGIKTFKETKNIGQAIKTGSKAFYQKATRLR